MKKQIIIGALSLAAIVTANKNVHAQSNTTATTQVQITLADVISIDDGSVANGGLVAFNYLTAEDYNSTRTVDVPTSLKVTSSKDFVVTATAGGTDFESASSAATIPVSVLTIRPLFNGTMNGTAHSVILSDQPQVLIENAELGSLLTVDLQYEIPKERSSSSDILGKPAEVYTQTVTYTATAL